MKRTDQTDGIEYIYIYSRKQALEDGVLLDASSLAKEAGFLFPVALTSAAWGTCVDVPQDCEGQDEAGRLWDVLWMLKYAIKQRPSENPLRFSVIVQTSSRYTQQVELKSMCGPGDNAEPVITVMLPDED